MRKKIGISYTEANNNNYKYWFNEEDLGTDLELIELSFMRNNVEDIYACDGFVLTGGIDVLPSLFGGKETYPHMPDAFLPERDEFERLIYVYAQQQRVPVLGICRGMQYINILEGGTVFEDIGDTANAVHKKGETDKVHKIIIKPGTLLHTLNGGERGTVNSAHHQAINPERLADSLKISAYADSPDHIAEAIEFKDKSNRGFMLAVQWHPERMEGKEQNPLSQKIKEQFIHEVRNYHP